MLTISINKKHFSITPGTTILDLIVFLDFSIDLTVIEYNSFVLPKVHWATTVFRDYDSLEFITIVGGG